MFEQEIWKDIPNYEGKYQISNLGNIRHFGKTKLIKQQINKDDYSIVSLRNGKTKKTYRVHRLVAKAFIPNPENKPQINHIDGNKRNNCVINLEWVNASENIRHAHKIGIYNQKQHSMAMNKYKKKVAKIKNGKIVELYESLSLASQLNNVSKQCIHNAIKNPNYTCVGFEWKYLGEN